MVRCICRNKKTADWAVAQESDACARRRRGGGEKREEEEVQVGRSAVAGVGPKASAVHETE